MQTCWIAADWGTSHLRIWVLGASGAVIAHRTSDKGMGNLAPGEFETALLELVDPYLPEGSRTPLIACGMVGARQGWAEAPYIPIPDIPPGLLNAIRPKAHDPRLDVFILPGMMQADPVDVMRGEETQILGFIKKNPGFDGVLCLPGTHSKWVRVRAGTIVTFRTFMTGELFALLSKRSVLRHSMMGEGWNEAEFIGGVRDAMASPKDLSSGLFELRAEALVYDVGADVIRARLSGLLVGLELAGARSYWLGRDTAIIGEPRLSDKYAAALAAQGVMTRSEDGNAMTLAGLSAVVSNKKELPV